MMTTIPRKIGELIVASIVGDKYVHERQSQERVQKSWVIAFGYFVIGIAALFSMAAFSESSLTNSASPTLAKVTLQNSRAASEDSVPYTINPIVFSLPDLRGHGNIPNLAAAMSRDAALLQMVQSFAADPLSGASNWNSEVQAILYRWVGVENVNPGSRGPNVNAQQLEALEALVGKNWRNLHDGGINPNAYQGELLTGTWSNLIQEMGARLMIQGPLAKVFSTAEYSVNSDLFASGADPASFAADIASVMPTDPAKAKLFWTGFSPIAARVELVFSESTGATKSAYAEALQSLFDSVNLPLTAVQVLSVQSSGTDVKWRRSSVMATAFILFGAMAGGLAGLWLAYLQWRAIFRTLQRARLRNPEHNELRQEVRDCTARSFTIE